MAKEARRARMDSDEVEVGGVGYRYLVIETARPTPHATLTEAERAVVSGVLRGLSNAQIAADRGASVRTVANQLASIFRKLGVRSRHELIARVTTTSRSPGSVEPA
jgi:DNA-binding NarL/FixJ family response regulator